MFRIRHAAVLVGLVAAAPAFAYDLCDDLWFARNLAFDRAGYCFASPLGRAVFDNADCIGTDVALPPEARRLVAFVQARELAEGCKVDTARTALDLDRLDLLLRQEVLTAPGEFASGCLGWQGAPITLRAGPRPEAPAFGLIEPGDDIATGAEVFAPVPADWLFVSVMRGAAVTLIGWVPAFDWALCRGNAG